MEFAQQVGGSAVTIAAAGSLTAGCVVQNAGVDPLWVRVSSEDAEPEKGYFLASGLAVQIAFIHAGAKVSAVRRADESGPVYANGV
ncbi:hypothetical protein [Candidatus Venteria ishoeyi]|uniref:Uncharacterized protein n=1 Tax=Candidatus Venteria ishoeyi TaxID=1899563 RepID=A0A1H6FBK0_9GAMM|nr:hypothetical protein [Candidatus Venteria ishoeyi]SEH06506.1 Uncharacterised protein [Candidatus Venteria ishoeyi]